MKITKSFTLEEHSNESMWYEIRIFDWLGKEVDRIVRPTQVEACRVVVQLGYENLPAHFYR